MKSVIDTQLLGQTAAKCMEDLDDTGDLDGGEIIAVGIMVIAQNEDKTISFNRTYCSDVTYYRQLGLFETAVGCVRDGHRYASSEEE